MTSETEFRHAACRLRDAFAAIHEAFADGTTVTVRVRAADGQQEAAKFVFDHDVQAMRVTVPGRGGRATGNVAIGDLFREFDREIEKLEATSS